MNQCSECAKLYKTCCETAEAGVTSGDIARITAFTGRTDFYSLEPVAEEHKYSYENPWNCPDSGKIYVKYFFDEEGRRNILKKNDKGGCIFLAQDGCMLPMDVRPIICRLYPYSWTDQREISLEASSCPAHLFKDEQDLKENLCVPEDEALRLVNLFYDEIMNK